MAENSKEVAEEKLKQTTCEAVDDLSDSVKKASRHIFDAMVERTAEVFSDLLDSVTSKAKEKVKQRGEDDEEGSNVPD